MKFNDGAWLWAKGVTPTTVKRVFEYSIDRNRLLIAALDRHGKEGADRFEGLVLQLQITSPMPDVIRVKTVHHEPHRVGPTGFDLDYSMQNKDVTIEDKPDHLVFTSGRLSVTVRKSDWDIQFHDTRETGPSSVVTGGAGNSLGYMQVDGKGSYMMQRLGLGVGECIYGMGERFGPLVKNGQTVTIWNEDGGTVSDQAYKSVPFYLSSRGYGLLVNTPGLVEFEVATERVSQIQFSTPGEELDYYIFYGPDLKDVLAKYTTLSGRAAVPPAWSFGLWLSTSFTTHYNEQTVNEFVDGMFKRGIPLSVFHFDCFWMKERHWCDFEWDRDAFPDPEGMLKRLKAKGLKICVWINSYISALSKLFPEGREKGYFIKTTDGSVFQRDQWQPEMGIVDFTNPEAVKWYQSKLKKLLDMGVDCFKTDFGERIPWEGVTYHDGSDPKLMHNYYPYLYNKAVFELLENYHGKGKAIVFARSATAGSQKFPVHWGGDCEATWESMAEDMRGGLSFCMTGPAFWSHDIGGFSGKANPSIYKRWVAFGLLSTHSRLHGSESYRVPWLFDEESVDVMRHFVQLKHKLFPYLYSAAHDAAEKGFPVMRAMVLDYREDKTAQRLEHQYMLGDALLVAPVLRQDDVAEYYLPKGKWTHLTSGKLVEGGQWFSEKLGMKDIPLYARENSIVAMSANAEKPEWKQSDVLDLHLFELTDGADVSQRVVGSDDESVVVRCRRTGGKISVECAGKLKKAHVHVHHKGTTKTSDWPDSGKPLTVALDG